MKLSELDPQKAEEAPLPEPQEEKKKTEKKKPPRKKRSFLGRLFCFFVGFVTLIACIGIGLGILLFTWASRDLPDVEKITSFEASQSTTIYARDGSLLGILAHEKRFLVDLNEMPKYLPLAFLAIEDSSFYEHPGINIFAIIRASLVNLERGTKSQGGSTITQQLVKQLLLTSERSYTRKMKEAILATQLEQKFSKDQILSLYLNYIYLGQHSYGVEAAARTYFGKSVSGLTLAEAALIAGMPQAPSRYNPFRHPKTAKQRQMEVLNRLRTLKWITEEDYQQASVEPLVYWSLPDTVDGPAKWYFEETRRLLIEFFSEQNIKALGIKTDKSGADYVYEAGLTVQTAMDPQQQEYAGEALRNGLEALDKRQGWRGPIRHLATQEERNTFLKQAANFNPMNLRAGKWVQGLISSTAKGTRVELGNGYYGMLLSSSWAQHRSSLAEKSSGSKRLLNEGDVIWVSASERFKATSLKDPKNKKKATPKAEKQVPVFEPGKAISLCLQQEPLVQGALVSIEPVSGDVVALIGGYEFGGSGTHFNRATQARRQPGSTFKPIVYSAALDEGFTPSSSVLDAPIEIWSGGKLWKPSNSDKNYRGVIPLATALLKSLNLPTVRLGKAIGVNKVIDRAHILGLEVAFPRVLPVCLGAVGVSPLNLTQAYAAFANGGLGVRPRIITSIKDANGRVLYSQGVEHWQAVSPQNAYQMTTLLTGVVNRGTGMRAQIPGLNIAGKTGTTNDEHDVWFIGFTPYLCTGVYLGYDQVRSLGKREQGGRTAAPIFKNYRMKADRAYKDHPQQFTRPPGIAMSDGFAYQGSVSPGRSAIEGAEMYANPSMNPVIPDPSSRPRDTSKSSEDLIRDMF